MAEPTDYTNASQQILLALLEQLAAAPLTARSLDWLTAATGASRDQVFRAAWNADRAGWIERTDQGYRIAPRITQLAEQVRRQTADLLRDYLGPR